MENNPAYLAANAKDSSMNHQYAVIPCHDDIKTQKK